MTTDTSAATQTFMELLFPEPVANEYAETTSHGSRSFEADESANNRLININNLPVTHNDISHEVPTRLQCDHLIENVIGQLGNKVRTRSQSGGVNTCLYSCFISQIEPKNVEMALNEPNWVDAMHEELNQFEKLGVWTLLKLPKGKKSFDTRWVYRNKQDDSGVIVCNK